MSLLSVAGILAVLSLCSVSVGARTLLRFSPDGDLESVEVQNTMEDLEEVQSLLDEFGMENGDCSCSDLTCQCCKEIRVKKIHLKENCCVKLTYRPSDGMINVAITIGKHIIWQTEFPVGRPPSNCVDLSFLPFNPKACIEFYNFHLESKVLTGCSRITFKLLGKDIAKVELGCFSLKFVVDQQPEKPQVDFVQLMRAMKMTGNYGEIEVKRNAEPKETKFQSIL